MKVTSTQSGNQLTLAISAGETELTPTVRSTYNQLRTSVDAKGFRPGKAPDSIVERELGEEAVQAEVINNMAEKLYRQAVDQENFQPINNPHVEIKKFVPYSEIEIEFTVEVMPEVKLGKYTTIKHQRPEAEVADEEVDQIIESLRDRQAERNEVKRAAKEGDEVMLDFEGKKGGQPVDGAQAKDYPLILGSQRFIPGFEEEVTGLKAGDEKTFTLTFPEDYGEASIAGSQVEFSVTIHKVTELKKPTINDEFAASVGPFESLDKLKSDIRDHLRSEKEQQIERDYRNQVVDKAVEQAEVDVPESMLERELSALKTDFERSLDEHGLDEASYLKQTGKNRDEHEKELKEQAAKRVKTALVLTAIAKEESIEVEPDELEVRLQVIAGQYQDQKMQEQLQQPEARREIANQMLAEKTVSVLVDYADGSSSDQAKKTTSKKADKSSQSKPDKKQDKDKK